MVIETDHLGRDDQVAAAVCRDAGAAARAVLLDRDRNRRALELRVYGDLRACGQHVRPVLDHVAHAGLVKGLLANGDLVVHAQRIARGHGLDLAGVDRDVGNIGLVAGAMAIGNGQTRDGGAIGGRTFAAGAGLKVTKRGALVNGKVKRLDHVGVDGRHGIGVGQGSAQLDALLVAFARGVQLEAVALAVKALDQPVLGVAPVAGLKDKLGAAVVGLGRRLGVGLGLHGHSDLRDVLVLAGVEVKRRAVEAHPIVLGIIGVENLIPVAVDLDLLGKGCVAFLGDRAATAGLGLRGAKANAAFGCDAVRGSRKARSRGEIQIADLLVAARTFCVALDDDSAAKLRRLHPGVCARVDPIVIEETATAFTGVVVSHVEVLKDAAIRSVDAATVFAGGVVLDNNVIGFKRKVGGRVVGDAAAIGSGVAAHNGGASQTNGDRV